MTDRAVLRELAGEYIARAHSERNVKALEKIVMEMVTAS